MIAFSNASLGEDLRHPQVLVHHLDDAPARHAREHLAPRVDGGDRRIRRQAHARAPRPSTPSSTPCPSSCSGRPSATCTTRPRPCPPPCISPVLSISVNFHDDACRSRCPRRGTCRSASARRRRRSSAGRTTPRPSAAPAWSCRSPSSARRRRTDWRGSTPRRPSRPGCGTASSSAASPARRGSSPGTRAGSRPHRARRPCTCSASSRKCALHGVTSRPGVADADHRPAVELVVREALVLHPRAVDEIVAVVAVEPGFGAELALGFFRRSVGHGSSVCGELNECRRITSPRRDTTARTRSARSRAARSSIFAPEHVASISSNSCSPTSSTRRVAVDDLAAVEIDVLLLLDPQRRVGRELERRRRRAAVRRAAAGREHDHVRAAGDLPGRGHRVVARRVHVDEALRRHRLARTRTTSTRFVVPPLATAPSDFSRIVVSPPALLPGDGLLFISPFSRSV